MKTEPSNNVTAAPGLRSGGFSLVEILVTVTLLSFIILGLLAMFQQTQRAFRSSITQTDVLEGGRAITDMMVRELEQMTPSHQPYMMDPRGTLYLSTNFFANASLPVEVQDLPGTDLLRTNVLQQFFFLTEVNQEFTGIGYRVIPEGAGVGSLFRFSETATSWRVLRLSGRFLSAFATNMVRLTDGVVHLRVRAFATNGYPVIPVGNFFGSMNSTYAFGTNFGFLFSPRGPVAPVRNTVAWFNPADSDQLNLSFLSNAVPAFMELELGILEPQVLRRYRGIPTPEAQRQFLSNHVAQVHLFRQRIPIRNVDFTAYQ